MTKSAIGLNRHLVVLSFFLAISGCQKKSAGGGGGGGAADPTATVDTTQTGAIVVNPVTEPSTNPSTDPTPEATPEGGGGQLTLTAAPMSQKIPLRPAAMVGTLAVSLTTPTELERFEENRFVWNPAQVPLEELNKIVCILSKTGFHLQGDKGKYIAKILLDDCFKSQEAVARNPDSNQKTLPSDVVVDAKTASDGTINLDVWFTRVFDGDSTHSSAMMDVPIWQMYEKLDLNYFVRATIVETPSNINPFGVFDMRWEMTIIVDGDADAKPYQQGYVTTAKANDKVTLTYNQRNWTYDDQECNATASARYNNLTIQALNEGASLNGTILTFNGTTTTINGALAVANVNGTPTDLTGSVTVLNFSDPVVVPSLPEITLGGGVTQVNSWLVIDGVRFTNNSNSDRVITLYAGDTVSDVTGFYGVTADAPGETELTSTGDFTLINGVMGVVASGSANGLTVSASTQTATVNGAKVQFDGVKTLGKAKDDFYNVYNIWFEVSIDKDSMIPPAGTATLNGGVDRNPSKITVSTPETPVFDITTQPFQAVALNGFKVRFDGVTSIRDTFSEIKWPVTGMPSFSYTGFDTEVPAAGTFEFSGGVGPAKDIWANIREFAASAQMDLVTGKPVKGKAHTAENWSRENTTNHCSFLTPNWTPKPVSYGLVFDKYDTYPGHQLPANTNEHVTYPGRAAVKQFSDYVDSGAVNGFDANATRCEQMGGELANVWQYELFTDAGDLIDYQTNFPLYLEGSTSSWGDGWASEWGISIWGEVSDGDRAYIKNKDGSKRWFDIVKFDGVLRDEMYMTANDAQSSGTVAFTCDEYCPSGTITSTMLDYRWDPTYFMYAQEYVFDYASKKLYRDTDQDGDGDEHVKLDTGIQGWFEIQMKLKSDNTKQYRYVMDSWSSEISLKEGGVTFVVPKPIEFDKTQVYTSADHAYPGSEVFNASHNNSAFADLISGDKLKFEYGNVCCFDWEQKSDIKDQWGNDAWSQKIVLKKGAQLKVDPNAADPDGSGLITPGMNVRVAPAFTELMPISKNDCSADMETAVGGIEAALPLPAPLPAGDRNIKEKIGARPTGAHPVLIINGELP